VVSDAADGQSDTGRPESGTGRPGRAQRAERTLLKSVDQDSAVGWTPGVTDWLTGKSRPVGSRGT